MSFSAYAQIDHVGSPLSWNISQAWIDDSNWETLPAINVSNLLLEDESEMADKSLPFRFAYASEVNFNFGNSGTWTNLHNGDRIWMLGIESAGAFSLGLSFSEFNLPPGAKLYIYTEDHHEFIGPFNSESNRSTQLTTPPVHDDRIIVEYYEPYAYRGDGNIQIAYASHAYRNLLSWNELDETRCLEMIDVESADSRIRNASSSVLMMMVDNGQRIATGTLLNNTSNDATPYLITASSALMGNPFGWVFLFDVAGTGCFSENTSCWSAAVCGAQVMKTDTENGTALLRLRNSPRRNWLAYYSGWRLGISEDNDSFQALHQSLGMPQSISEYSELMNPSSFQGYNTISPAHGSDGGTFAGAIGSPLFDEDMNLVGVFLGGDAECAGDGADHFAPFDASWLKYKNYLDPFSLAPDRLEGIYPQMDNTQQDERPFRIFFFPNPAKEWIYVQNESDEVITDIRIYDASGRLMRSFKPLTPLVDLSNLPEGLYNITFISDGAAQSQKLLIR